jgi:hypothetical protein
MPCTENGDRNREVIENIDGDPQVLVRCAGTVPHLTLTLSAPEGGEGTARTWAA